LYGPGGIAASMAFGAWSSALALARRGVATFGFSIDTAARRRLPRIVAAALVMGGLLWLAAPIVLASAGNTHRLAQAVLVALLISGGMAVYGLLLAALGVIRWGDAVNAIRQTASPGLRD
jgi:putative peptidoglycan lipid II flippase